MLRVQKRVLVSLLRWFIFAESTSRVDQYVVEV
jgi:hypothetical protein